MVRIPRGGGIIPNQDPPAYDLAFSSFSKALFIIAVIAVSFHFVADAQNLQLSFPLRTGSFTNAWTAPITSVFDHSADTRYCSNGVVVAFTGETGTVMDTAETPVAGSCGGHLLYSYKKADGRAFYINGHYVGTSITGANTLNYDGHPGYDYPVPSDTPVYAAADGVVVTAVSTDSSSSGKYIQIEHTGGQYLSQYIHLSRVDVVTNQTLVRGDLIGMSGDSGGVAAHLHFETKVKVDGVWISVDPYGWAGTGPDPYTLAVNARLWADASPDTITSVMSPIVSYHYPDDYGSQALTNGGLMSPVASYQYEEWPGDDVLKLESSAWVSYYYQFALGNGPVVLSGRVTDTAGTPLAGARVSVMVFLSEVVQTSTDAGGNYTIASVEPGVYDLWASAVGYQGSIRAVTLGEETARQDFQMKAIPRAAETVQGARVAPFRPSVDAKLSRLLWYNGTMFTSIDTNSAPSPNLPSVVLTHGWVPEKPDTAIMSRPFDRFPTNTAAQLVRVGVTPAVANIFAWDWRYAAMSTPPMPTRGVDATPDQGVALGKALTNALGKTYSSPVHFVGHSLGTLVNAAAANFLRGDPNGSARRPFSDSPWEGKVCLTLLDHAQIAELAGQQVLLDGLDPVALHALEAVTREYDTTHNWQAPLPNKFTWADNYISIVGYQLPNAVNAWLVKGIADHSYPVEWYGWSILDPLNAKNPLGFRNTHEFSVMSGVPFLAPGNLQPGTLYRQVESDPNRLALETVGGMRKQLGMGADYVLTEIADKAAEVVGNVVVGAREFAQRIDYSVFSTFNYVAGLTSEGGEGSVGLGNAAVLGLKLRTAPAAEPGAQIKDSPTLKDFGSGDHGHEAMAWLPVIIPANAVLTAFDFTVVGDPVDDVIAFGIGTNNLFSLQAKYVPTNGVSASRPVDVSGWAGTTNEIFFGLLGGTSTNCTVEIDNIRFYSLQQPALEVEVEAGGAVLTWPLTGGGYALEKSASLVGGSWERITNASVITADRYVITNAASGGSMFYRLRRL